MHPAPTHPRREAFTLVELLLAISLGVLVAAILAALIHGLLSAGGGQTARLQGPAADRAALRSLSREIACAVPPPVRDLAPMRLSTSTEPGKPDVRLAFYVPVPAEPAFAHGFDIEQVAFEVQADASGLRELRRISAPCSGPLTNAPVTTLLLAGRFTLAIEALTNDTPHAEWPPPGASPPVLPTSVRLSLSRPGEEPLRTEVLVQTALGIRSPLEREPDAPDAPPESEAPPEPEAK